MGIYFLFCSLQDINIKGGETIWKTLDIFTDASVLGKVDVS